MKWLQLVFFLIMTLIPIECEISYSNFTDEIGLFTKLENNIFTIYIQKKTKGFLALGFGANMTKGDIFILEINTDNKLTIRSCQLVGFQGPACSSQNYWQLIDYKVLDDGSWTAVVQRDINLDNGYMISPESNKLIYFYSESPTMDHNHNEPSAVQSVQVWNLQESRAHASILKWACLLLLFISIAI